MDMQGKFIPRAQLDDWLAELAARFRVWTPRRAGQEDSGAVVYLPEARQPELNRKPTESAKRVIFPRSEPLLRFLRKPDPDQTGQKSLELQVPDADGPNLVFGLPPCDARGFLVLDPVYAGVKGQAGDSYYLRRRSQTVLIARACSRALTTCFCHWVGGSPSSTEGLDVLATEIQEGFLLQPLTPQGEEVLDSKLLLSAGKEQMEAAQSAWQAAEKTLGPGADMQGAQEALRALFDNAAFWQAEAASCLSCGVCTHLCPTCYCFNITDEAVGEKGVRLRSWDACMFSLYTQEASGHNPRQDKAARLKNRIGHKFSYYPELHQTRYACVGCGRCIKSCPSRLDIRAVLTKALALAPAAAKSVEGKPATTAPAAAQPATVKPKTSKSGATKPAAAKSGTTKRGKEASHA